MIRSEDHRHWLFAVWIAANLLFAAVLAGALWNSRQHDIELQQQTGQNLALAIERNVSGTFDKVDLALQEISDRLEEQLTKGAVDHRKMAESISRLANRMLEVSVMDYSDANGAVPASSGFPANNLAISVADRDYFLTLKANPNAGLVSSKPVIGRTSKAWVVVFARRIRQADGRFVGVVYASISVNYFTDVFQRFQLGPQGVVTVLDQDFAFIARYPAPDPKLLGQRIPQEWLIDVLKSDQQAFTRVFRTHVDGEERRFSFQRLAGRPYHVTVGLSTEELLTAFWRQLALAAAVFAAFAGVTALGVFQLLRSWQKQGEITDRLEVEKDRYRSLNQALETRVEQRTVELLSANNELKQAMEHLGNSEKFAALGSLVAGVTHELNTPIGNLRLAASTYKDRLQTFSAQLASGNIRRSTLTEFLDDAQEFVALLDRSAERASEMISSFKTVAVDQSSSRRRVFELKQAVDDVLSTLQQKLKRAHCRVTNDIPPDLSLDSYPGAFMQIVTNLVENAMLHAFDDRDEGAMRIGVHSTTTEEVALRFSDNGKGISDADAERIFEPFYSTKIGQGGSGLGLHLVRQIAAVPLGGSLELDREASAGASFILHLPRLAPDKAD